MSIKIHFYLFLFMSYVFYIGKLELFLIFYISILIHEIAHIVAALLLRINVTELLLMPFGVSASYNEKISRKKEIIISIAGPLMSLIISILSKDILIKSVNLLIMILNLIPIYPLDGGRIQKNFFEFIFGYKKGLKISETLSDFFVVLVFIISIFLIIYFRNYYLL